MTSPVPDEKLQEWLDLTETATGRLTSANYKTRNADTRTLRAALPAVIRELQATRAERDEMLRDRDLWKTRSHDKDMLISGFKTDLAVAERELQAARKALDTLKNRIDAILNDHLCEMKPDYDDSMVGFNEAWDIVRKVFDDAKARAALPPEAVEP